MPGGRTALPRAGAAVRAQRRTGGRWHRARVAAVRDGACDLEFPHYGVVAAVPAERIQATRARPRPPRPKPAPALRKPKVRAQPKGHAPAEPYRGDRKLDKTLKESIGWVATRGDVDLLEAEIKRRGLDESDAHGWSWLHHAAASGATAHLKAMLRFVRDDDEDADESPLDAREDLNGMMPLHLACVAKHVDAVRVLLKAGAAVDAKDGDGYAAAALAGKGSHRARRVRALLASRGETSDYSSSESEGDDEGDNDDDGAPAVPYAPQCLPDREYESRPCAAPRHLPGACRCCDALDACDARARQRTAVWIPPVRAAVGRLPPDGRTWTKGDGARYYAASRRNLLGTTRRG